MASAQVVSNTMNAAQHVEVVEDRMEAFWDLLLVIGLVAIIFMKTAFKRANDKNKAQPQFSVNVQEPAAPTNRRRSGAAVGAKWGQNCHQLMVPELNIKRVSAESAISTAAGSSPSALSSMGGLSPFACRSPSNFSEATSPSSAHDVSFVISRSVSGISEIDFSEAPEMMLAAARLQAPWKLNEFRKRSGAPSSAASTAAPSESAYSESASSAMTTPPMSPEAGPMAKLAVPSQDEDPEDWRELRKKITAAFKGGRDTAFGVLRSARARGDGLRANDISVFMHHCGKKRIVIPADVLDFLASEVAALPSFEGKAVAAAISGLQPCASTPQVRALLRSFLRWVDEPSTQFDTPDISSALSGLSKCGGSTEATRLIAALVRKIRENDEKIAAGHGQEIQNWTPQNMGNAIHGLASTNDCTESRALMKLLAGKCAALEDDFNSFGIGSLFGGLVKQRPCNEVKAFIGAALPKMQCEDLSGTTIALATYGLRNLGELDEGKQALRLLASHAAKDIASFESADVCSILMALKDLAIDSEEMRIFLKALTPKLGSCIKVADATLIECALTATANCADSEELRGFLKAVSTILPREHNGWGASKSVTPLFYVPDTSIGGIRKKLSEALTNLPEGRFVAPKRGRKKAARAEFPGPANLNKSASGFQNSSAFFNRSTSQLA